MKKTICDICKKDITNQKIVEIYVGIDYDGKEVESQQNEVCKNCKEDFLKRIRECFEQKLEQVKKDD